MSMEDLDDILAVLDNPRASTRPSHRAPSAQVNYDELNELMQDLASPVDTKPSHAQHRVSQAPSYNSNAQGSDDLDDLLKSLSNTGGTQSNRNTQQPVRNTQQYAQPPTQQYAQPPSARNTQQFAQPPSVRNTQQPVRNTQSAAQLDDLDELLRNLGPPSSSTNNNYSQDRQSMAPVRASVAPVRPVTQQFAAPQPVQQVARPAPTTSAVKPTGRVLDGPDLDDMLRDINRTSTRGLDGGPSSRGDCAHCRKPILGEVIQALNRTYHPEHFVCGNCQMPLGTSNFYEQDGVPNCERCYQELFCSRCAHCDEPITGKCITALNRKWHFDHFICGQCLGPFPGGTFFEKEGRPYCDNCFHNSFSSRCAGCNQSIKGECINALGQQWHPEHFVCQYCQKSFGTGSFYEYGGKPYCETHYHQQTGSLCAGCGKAVTGRMINALDKKWHPEHFVCSFCMHPLAGGAFTENGGKAYCKECHGKLFG
jgi:paxillin